MLHAERTQIRPLRRARGGEDLRPRGLGQLDGSQSHAPRAGVDQDPVAGFQSGDLPRERRGHEDLRHGGESGGRQPRRSGRHQFPTGDDFGAQRPEREADHAVSRRDAGHLATDLEDPAAHLFAEEPSLDQPHRPEHVEEVQPAGLDRNPDFAGRERTRRPGDDPQFLERAALVRGEVPVMILRQGQALRAAPGADKSGRQPAVPPVRDIGLRIGKEQLFRDLGGRCGRGGVEIQHPGLQVARFPGDHPAESPERRARELSRPLPFEDLGAARNEPRPPGRGRIGVGQTLDEREGAPRRVAHVRRQLPRGGVRPAAVEPCEMHDPGEREIPGRIRQERSPSVAAVRFEGFPDDPVRLVAGGRGFSVHEHDGLVSRREFRRQFRAHPAAVPRNHPDARTQGHLRRSAGHDHPPVRQAAGLRFVHPDDFRFLESGVTKRPAPHLGAGQRVTRAVLVGEPPPAVELSENQVHPAPAALVLKRDELSRGGEEFPAVVQRLVEVPRGVEHVGGNRQVVTVVFEALRHRVLLDVQDAVFDPGVLAAEPGLGVREETRGDVRVGVVEPAGLELRQDAVGCRPDPRADLDHPEGPPFRESGDDHLHHVPQHPVGGAPDGRLGVEIAGPGRLVAEQERQGVFTAPKHFG